jgi:3-oxoacyl-[acyl-carrier-protein] synthase II
VKPLAITGLGVVSPIGVGRSAWNHALDDHEKAHEVAFKGTPTVLSPEVALGSIAAEVWDFDATLYLGNKGLRNFDRLTKFLIVAGKLALEDAGLEKKDDLRAISAERIGVCSATAYGSLDSITELLKVSELEDPRYVNPGRFPNTVINSSAAYVSIWEDLRAPNTTVVDGNCGSLDAILTCENHLSNQRADAFLVGGGEILNDPLYIAFRKLGILAEGEAIYAPGSPDSRGMRLGEGAVYLCVERLNDAVRRGASIRGEIIGYGNAFEPPSSEAILVHVSRAAIERAIHMALQDASIESTDIDVACIAANGITQFDNPEREALAAIFGSDIAIAVPKAIYGETLGASGAFGIANVLSWFEGVRAAPLIAGKAPAHPMKALVVTVGFYGNASAVVLMRRPAIGKIGEA